MRTSTLITDIGRYPFVHAHRMFWERLKGEEKGRTEDEMVGYHHRLSGREFKQALGVGDGQGSLVCCSPWVAESDTTERLK